MGGLISSTYYALLVHPKSFKTFDLTNKDQQHKSADIVSNSYAENDSMIAKIKNPEHQKICKALNEFAKSHYSKKGILSFEYNDEIFEDHTPFLTLDSKFTVFETKEYSLNTTVDKISIHENFINAAISFGGGTNKAIELLKPLVLNKVEIANEQSESWFKPSILLDAFLVGSLTFSKYFALSIPAFFITQFVLPNLLNRFSEANADQAMFKNLDEAKFVDSLKFLNLFKQLDEQTEKPKNIQPIKSTVPSLYQKIFKTSNHETQRIKHFQKVSEYEGEEIDLSLDDFISNHNTALVANTISFGVEE